MVQAGFRKRMGCTDQVFFLRCFTQKLLPKSHRAYCAAFVDLEKAYDQVVESESWSPLSVNRVSSSLIRALKSLYEDSTCVRVNEAYTDWLNIDKGVRQGCVASPWLFNLFMDNSLTRLKETDCGLRMTELRVKCLLYAGDQVILSSSADELQKMVTIMNEALMKKGMKVNFNNLSNHHQPINVPIARAQAFLMDYT
jgi:hypothetical protein